jgi:hypothetical protein
MREEDAANRFNIFLRCATHLHLHVGQMIYLQYALLRERTSLEAARKSDVTLQSEISKCGE